jgi:hypothetical protein
MTRQKANACDQNDRMIKDAKAAIDECFLISVIFEEKKYVWSANCSQPL